VSQPGTLVWLAVHEFRLAWRDFRSMLTAGRRRRTRTIAIALIAVAAFMHFVAYKMVGGFAEQDGEPDKATLIAVTVAAMLAWSMMLSQALESVTRAFYARSDLDLILSSPADARKIFVVRIGALGVSAIATALMIAAPFINVLAFLGGPRWLGGYAAAVAIGAAAAAIAVAMTAAMFRLIGPKRTRLAAQIIAAIIGAAFVIGLQAGAILSFGTISRFTLTQSVEFLRLTPDVDSAVWWPARAILGEPAALALAFAASIALLGIAVTIFSRRFADDARAAVNAEVPTLRRQARAGGFRQTSRTRALRLKEWTLLRRDPWLVSQTLMQLLYLLPPALLLWRSFGERGGTLILLVPVLVMAAGQLAGGLAWLAVSGEDAPDLIASAPVAKHQAIRAKIEAVIGAVAIVFAPLIVVFAAAAFMEAAVTILGIVVAAGAATAIQLWFRAQAKRSHFRRRQTSSRLATFSEAFSSIGWAATAGLAASGTWLALAPALMTASVLSGAYYLRPRPA
jgi:ABC-2 type transport system permease protein